MTDAAWGSAAHHRLVVEPYDTRTRCGYCATGQRKRVTHKITANGVALSSGCEFHAYKDRREMCNTYHQEGSGARCYD